MDGSANRVCICGLHDADDRTVVVEQLRAGDMFTPQTGVVLLPVPDSPRNSTAPPFRLMTDEWMAMACRATAAMLNIDHNPKRNSAGLCRSVTSVVTSGAPNALRKRAAAQPSRGVMVSR